MDFHLQFTASIIIIAGITATSAGAISIGAPTVIGVSPGLNQRCLQKLGVKAQGAQAARAVHECRKPADPAAQLNNKPTAASIK